MARSGGNTDFVVTTWTTVNLLEEDAFIYILLTSYNVTVPRETRIATCFFPLDLPPLAYQMIAVG